MAPDFLGIGAQKAGTTWLHDNLSRHPNVWLPPVKEIHYFDHEPDSLRARLYGRTARHRSARRLLRKRLFEFLIGNCPRSDFEWALRYCLGRRSDDWYLSLFKSSAAIISGEICPGYARLAADQVLRVKALLPHAKIIYLIRHPVERAWSAAVMHFNDKGGISKFDNHKILEWLKRPKTLQHSGYSDTVKRWKAAYADRLLVLTFDDLERDPALVLKRVQEFLALPIDVPPDVSARRNVGHWTIIPENFRSVLQELCRAELKELHAHFGQPFSEEWLNRYEKRPLAVSHSTS